VSVALAPVRLLHESPVRLLHDSGILELVEVTRETFERTPARVGYIGNVWTGDPIWQTFDQVLAMVAEGFCPCFANHPPGGHRLGRRTGYCSACFCTWRVESSVDDDDV